MRESLYLLHPFIMPEFAAFWNVIDAKKRATGRNYRHRLTSILKEMGLHLNFIRRDK